MLQDMAGERDPIRVAVAGLGGFAGSHHEALLALERESACRVVATCDPDLAAHQADIQRCRLAERGVRMYGDLRSLLAAESQGLDVVTLPTPIPLHAAQHRAVVEAGLACYLEKPPTLAWSEYRSMMEVERAAKVATQVGFNFVGDPMRRGLKARILAGEFGRVRGATLWAVWPRDRAYYGRNAWAGRLEVDGRSVMDSPTGNAVAHFVQDLLFWCGEGETESVAAVLEVRARLRRAHAIESFDTAFMEATLSGGRWLRIGVTHTGLGDHSDRETIECERATIVFDGWRSGRICHSDGRLESLTSASPDNGVVLRENLRRYFEYVRGDRPRPITTLADCEAFVALSSLAFLSAGTVQTYPEARITRDAGRVDVSGLDAELTAFVEQGTWPDGIAPRAARRDELAD